MRRNLLRTILLATAVAAAAPPAVLHAQQSDSTRAERDRQRERAREAADRDRERQRVERDRQRVERDRARDEARRSSGADADWADDDERDDRAHDGVSSRIDTTVTFGANGVVDLTLVSGEIVVTAGPRGQAHVRATSEGGGAIRFEHGPDRLSLDIQGRRSHGDTHYAVTVPEGTRVLMRSTSGDLTAHGVKGELEARTTSGDVDISDAVRSVTIETVSGDVTAARLSGDVHGSSVSGDVEIDGVTGDVDFGSVSGSITLANARGRSVHLGAVSGDLRFEGALDPAGRYEFGTHSGEVTLRLPADASATVSAQSFSGDVDSAFPVTIQPAADGARRSGRRMEFTLGRGGPHVSAETFSGNITLERGTSRGSN